MKRVIQTKMIKVTDEELEASIAGFESTKGTPVAGRDGIAPNVHTVSYSEEVSKIVSPIEQDDEGVEIVTNVTTEVTTLPPISIHDKFRKYITMIDNGYLRDLNYNDAMEMLRWMEKKRNTTIPLNYSCGNCMFDLVKMFKHME